MTDLLHSIWRSFLFSFQFVLKNPVKIIKACIYAAEQSYWLIWRDLLLYFQKIIGFIGLFCLQNQKNDQKQAFLNFNDFQSFANSFWMFVTSRLM